MKTTLIVVAVIIHLLLMTNCVMQLSTSRKENYEWSKTQLELFTDNLRLQNQVLRAVVGG